MCIFVCLGVRVHQEGGKDEGERPKTTATSNTDARPEEGDGDGEAEQAKSPDKADAAPAAGQGGEGNEEKGAVADEAKGVPVEEQVPAEAAPGAAAPDAPPDA